ncbi:hypothetical protein PROFUN_01903 [Planoprotostelium fungivorum]|uniref:Uncharacterized protein n=1 Tax=Planoprotostelium fungivorum TaxID=1890364 RepID=A0A2P6NZ01_9EUKA|nr:hypothetical protein PROFUN_01903 [Planoprotostelium fungivorum]
MSDDEIPRAEPIPHLDLSLDVENDVMWQRKKVTAREEKGMEWAININLSKPQSEKELWEVYKNVKLSSHGGDGTGFPGAVSFLGFSADGNQSELFGEKFLMRECGEEPEQYKVTMPNRKPKRPKKFQDILVVVKLISRTYHSVEDLSDEEEEEEEEMQEEDQAMDAQPNSEGEIEVVELFNDDRELEPELIGREDLQKLLVQVQEATKNYDKKAKIAPEEPAADGAKRAETLAETIDFCDHVTGIELLAPRGGFSGPQLYDTLVSLGFTYEPESKQFLMDLTDHLSQLKRDYNKKKKINPIRGGRPRRPEPEEDEEEEESGLMEVVGSTGMENLSQTAMTDPQARLSSLSFQFFLPHCRYPFTLARAVVLAAEEIVDIDRRPCPSHNPVIDEVKEMMMSMQRAGLRPGSPECGYLF